LAPELPSRERRAAAVTVVASVFAFSALATARLVGAALAGAGIVLVVALAA
jgi:hypothetical protein